MNLESSTPDTSDPPDDSTLFDIVDSDHSRASRIGRRVVLSFLAIFVIAALADVFGMTSTATSGSTGYELTVSSPRTTRAGMDARTTLELHSTQTISGPLTIEVAQDYLDAFSTYDISPAPDAESSNGRFLVLEFDPPAETGFRLDIDGTASEDSVLLAKGEVRIYVGDDLVASTGLKTWKVL